MKRTIAAGLSAALLCGMVVPAFAADTKTATNTTGTTQTQPTAPVKLTFDKLEEIVDDQIWPLPKYRELLFLR